MTSHFYKNQKPLDLTQWKLYILNSIFIKNVLKLEKKCSNPDQNLTLIRMA